VSWLGFSPDGRTLASAAAGDAWLAVWDVPLLPGYNGYASIAAFSPDGNTLHTLSSIEYKLCYIR
jgi:WD40 repeat protein